MSEQAHKEAGELLDPILDVMGGADGGVAFTKLRHEFLPGMLAKRGTSEQVDEFILMVERFSRLCTIMQGK